MKVPLLTLAALSCALATANAQKQAPTTGALSVPKTANQNAVQGNGGLVPISNPRNGGQIAIVGSDVCTAPTATVGNGPHAYDTAGATTGTQGQAQVICNHYGNPAIQNDVWFTYTTPAGPAGTGIARLTTCGTTLSGTGAHDTRIAVYNGTVCPATNTAAIACDDDYCGPSFESQATWCSAGGTTYLVQLGNFPGGVNGSGTWSVTITPVGTLNNECGGSVLLVGNGPHVYDNSGASTGCTGQNNIECSQGFGSSAIENDIWFRWVATGTGTAIASTCSFTTDDTKLAVYAGTACPLTNTALACNDDACVSLQSSLCWPVTNGQSYLLQVGNFQGATGGPSSLLFTVTPPNPCQVDDGVSENLLGFIVGGDLVWLNRFGATSGSTTVNQIRATWGSPTGAGAGPGNGAPARVAIWDDPNEDGNPSDATLVQALNVTVANVDTDIFNTYPITQVNLTGYFFVGAAEPHAAGQFVSPMDDTCSPPGIGWVFGNNNATPADLAVPTNNVQQPVSMNAIGFPAVLLVRPNCIVGGPMTQFCVPGQAGVMPCPCANPPAGGGLGCNNFGAGPAQSGTLSAIGNASLAADTVQLQASGENNTSLTTFWSGQTGTPAAGIKHGAGVRCVSVNQKRLYTGSASGGAINRPIGTQLSVSARTAAVGATITAGQTRRYYCVYRDPNAAGPCGNTSDTINTTNAGAITWSP